MTDFERERIRIMRMNAERHYEHIIKMLDRLSASKKVTNE